MRYDAEAHKHVRAFRPFTDAMLTFRQLWDSTNDAIVRLPGCPPMFEWEFFPQAVGSHVILNKYVY